MSWLTESVTALVVTLLSVSVTPSTALVTVFDSPLMVMPLSLIFDP